MHARFHVATLRGMNPDQVLVLINGKRRHGIAFAKVLSMLGMGTTGTDLRAIPIHAIERPPVSARIRATRRVRTGAR